jgi:hypothetical protein
MQLGYKRLRGPVQDHNNLFLRDPDPAGIQAGGRPRECGLADNPIKRETIVI